MSRFRTLLVIAVTALPLLGVQAAAAPGEVPASARAGGEVSRLCVAASSHRVRLPAGASCAAGERTLMMRPSRRRGLCLRAIDVRRVAAGECASLGGVFRRVPSPEPVILCTTKGRWLSHASRAVSCRGDAGWVIGNHTPQDLALRANTVTATSSAGTIAGALVATDVDRGDHLSYALVPGEGDADNARFTLDGALVRIREAFPVGTYTIRVQARDLLGARTTAAFRVTVSP